MDGFFTRTEWLIGPGAMRKLRASHVAVFGLGGVGSYALEALARSGIGKLTIVDNDVVSASNINRQLIATVNTINRIKTEVASERIRQINPECKVQSFQYFWPAEVDPVMAREIISPDLDYIIDAIDSISSKISLIRLANENSIPIISCMGTGNKLDPSQLAVADLYDTEVCPLARIMRRELRRIGIRSLKTVFSKEQPKRAFHHEPQEEGKKIPPASIAFVPGAAGLLLASEVVRDLIAHDS